MKHFVHAALFAAILPATALAQHFSIAFIDIRLVKPDSVLVTVEADGEDMKNALRLFPRHDTPPGSGMASFRQYERMMEAYLQQKVKIRADDKPVNLSVVSWKPGGKGREDGFDTVSIYAANQAVTLGGRLPEGARTLSAWSEIWIERPEVTPDIPPAIEYYLFEGSVPLRRAWSRTERWVRFPVSADSLAAMRRNPIAPPRPRQPDHDGHNH